jgi:nitrile hydratase
VGHIGGILFDGYRNPEDTAFGGDGLPKRPVYHVHFPQRQLWGTYPGPQNDTLVVDIFEHWLEPAEAGN